MEVRFLFLLFFSVSEKDIGWKDVDFFDGTYLSTCIQPCLKTEVRKFHKFTFIYVIKL